MSNYFGALKKTFINIWLVACINALINQPFLVRAKQRSSTSRLLHCCELLLALVPLESARPGVTSCSQDKISSVVPLQLPQVTLFHHIVLRPGGGGHEGAGQRDQNAGGLAGAEELLVETRRRTRLHLDVVLVLLHLTIIHPGRPQRGFGW